MKITVLIENTKPDGESSLVCEHGLSLLIEESGRRLLLDSGSTESFFDNAKALNVSLTDLNLCVLSHGHYDHSGGYGALFKANPDIMVYARKSALNHYYSGIGEMHEIGIPENVLEYSDRFILVDGIRQISDNIYLVPHDVEGLSEIGKKAKLFKLSDGKIVPDDFSHEQSLVYDTPKGLVIFNSCSHAGVCSIISEARRAMGGKNVYAYVGGLHMKGRSHGIETCTFSDAEIDLLCREIKREEIKYVYTGHCTGLIGIEKMQERLGDMVRPLTTGLKFIIE
jgi:7,8-dihydropterin-6-yl-methyl-4-(beta-D-ribofuranosyl)aminobenzene 5'-phosphate synthase